MYCFLMLVIFIGKITKENISQLRKETMFRTVPTASNAANDNVNVDNDDRL